MKKQELIKELKNCRRKNDLLGDYIKTIKLRDHSYLKYSGNVRLDSLINIIDKNQDFEVIKNTKNQLLLYVVALDQKEYIILILKENRLF